MRGLKSGESWMKMGIRLVPEKKIQNMPTLFTTTVTDPLGTPRLEVWTRGGMGWVNERFYACWQRLRHGCANHYTEGKRFNSPIHCCDTTKPPYLFSGELCTSPLHCELFFVYIVCCRCTGQCFSVHRTRK